MNLILRIFFFIAFTLISSSLFPQLYNKGLMLEINILNENEEKLSAIIEISFKPKNAHNFDAFKIFTDSNAFVNTVNLKKGVYYEVLFSKLGFESKKIDIDTRNTSKNKAGYIFPMEIILKEGYNEVDSLKPIGIIFYDKKSDYYTSKIY